MLSAIRQSALRSRVAIPRVSARTAVRHSSSNAAMPKKTDLPWIIVSALVFIPTIFYMTSPPSDAHAHAHAAHAAAHHDEPEAAEEASEEVEEIAPVEEEAPAVFEAEAEAPAATEQVAAVEKEVPEVVDEDSALVGEAEKAANDA